MQWIFRREQHLFILFNFIYNLTAYLNHPNHNPHNSTDYLPTLKPNRFRDEFPATRVVFSEPACNQLFKYLHSSAKYKDWSEFRRQFSVSFAFDDHRELHHLPTTRKNPPSLQASVGGTPICVTQHAGCCYQVCNCIYHRVTWIVRNLSGISISRLCSFWEWVLKIIDSFRTNALLPFTTNLKTKIYSENIIVPSLLREEPP